MMAVSGLRHSESGTRGVRRILCKQVGAALEALDERGLSSDETIHDTRKRLKRVRAVLRLLREAMGEKRYRRENAFIRDAARPLTELRDAKVLLDAFDEMAGKIRNSAARSDLRPVREGLVESKREISRRLRADRRSIAKVQGCLRKARKRAQRWPVGRHGWSLLGPGLKRVYRKGRQSLTRAQSDSSVENLHELRKQAKYLWNDLRILEPAAPRLLAARIDALDRLGDALGDNHDHAALRDYLGRHCAELPGEAAREVFSRIDRQRRDLQKRALVVARRLYADKPKAFTSRVHEYWRAWKD
jgi:CHAD domain-containing protein